MYMQNVEPGYLSQYRSCLLTARPRVRSLSTGSVKNFLFSMSSRPALGPTQPPIQLVPGSSFSVGKTAGV
jgi:hypothetical protein